jgi:hypothetical protein
MGKGKILPDGSEGPPYKGWVNHPATLMWKGHTCFLAMYHNAMIDEWVSRGYKNNMQKIPHWHKPASAVVVGLASHTHVTPRIPEPQETRLLHV